MDSYIPDLRRIILDYLPEERFQMLEWYRKVIKELSSGGSSPTLEECECTQFLRYLNYLLEDEHFDLVKALMKRYPSKCIILSVTEDEHMRLNTGVFTRGKNGFCRNDKILYYAVRQGLASLVRYLYVHSSYNQPKFSSYVLKMSCEQGHLSMVEEYFPKVRRSGKDNAFNDAVTGGHMSVIKFFLDRKVPKETNALKITIFYDKVEILRYLIEELRYPIPSVNYAIEKGSLECLKYLESKGATLPSGAMDVALDWLRAIEIPLVKHLI